MNNDVLKELLYKMADDALILGHRNSEWTGLGPVLEEDIAFSSMAQDKIGHAQAIYNILHTILGENDPDQLAFNRPEKEFKSCHLVEYPIGEYDFSLVRQFYFDHAEMLRYKMLKTSSFAPIAQLAAKIHGELKYHVLHADTWISQLGNSTEEAKARIQTMLNELFPLALGIFEEGVDEQYLKDNGIFEGEQALKTNWYENISSQLKKSGLSIPEINKAEPVNGGRKGYHSEFLKPLLAEMSEVFAIDPSAEW